MQSRPARASSILDPFEIKMHERNVGEHPRQLPTLFSQLVQFLFTRSLLFRKIAAEHLVLPQGFFLYVHDWRHGCWSGWRWNIESRVHVYPLVASILLAALAGVNKPNKTLNRRSSAARRTFHSNNAGESRPISAIRNRRSP